MQVYFATDEASTVSLETGQQSFMVSIYRISPKGALTVNITSQDESGIFTIPSSVTFAEGTTKAEIPVSFDFDKLEPEKNILFRLLLTETLNFRSMVILSWFKRSVCPLGSMGKIWYWRLYIFIVLGR